MFEFNALNLCSINVRGIRDSIKRKAFFLYLRRQNSNILFLQETHSNTEDETFWKSQWGEKNYFCHGTNHSAGVAILMNKFNGSVIESVFSNEGRWIILILEMDNVKFIICNVYGPNRSSHSKNMFLNLSGKLLEIKNKYNNAVTIIGGDYNDAPDENMDRHPHRITATPAFKATSFLCQNLTLIDAWRFMNADVVDFTWSNTNHTQQSRIDLWLLACQDVQYISEVNHQIAPLSDHKLITLKVQGKKGKLNSRGYWKLNNKLLEDHQFKENVTNLATNIFDKEEMDCIQKWEFFKYKVREMAIARSKKIKKMNETKENELLNRIQELLSKQNPTEDERVNLKTCSEQLDKIYIDLAKGAFIRSRAKWLEQGEKNTSYFFSLEKRNRKQSNITSLNIYGNISSNSQDISNYITEFYRQLYESKVDVEKSQQFIEHIKQFTNKISEKYRDTCDEEIRQTELDEVIKSMKIGKSPGNDGLTVEFYICFWDIIKDMFFQVLKECINRNEMTTTMKQGLITLIPKPGKDHLIIENWRPISLLNTDYKIVAKLFSKRLKKYLDEIISENQNGFMANRHISSNIRLVLDLIDYSEHITSEALLLFLDFYKAFDSVEHSFIFKALKIFGFGDKFIQNVSMFYKDITATVLLYPNVSKSFPVLRGVRQGCPLSAFLDCSSTIVLAHIK